MAKKRIESHHFFGVHTIWGFLIGAVIAFIFFLIMSTTFSKSKRTLEFKKYLFYAAALKLNELNENSNIVNQTSAVATANFLKRELEYGNTIEKIVGEEMKIRKVLDMASNSDEREKIIYLFVSQEKKSQDILFLAKNNEWKEFRDNPENIKIFKELLLDNGKIPEIVYPKREYRMLIFLIVVSIIQFCIFVSYLIKLDTFYDHPHFYQLQWNKIGTYIVIVLLSPGMLVIVIPYFFWRLVSFDFFEFASKKREVNLIKKDNKRKEMEKSFDVKILRGKFLEHRKEGEALLAKLESRLKERGTL